MRIHFAPPMAHVQRGEQRNLDRASLREHQALIDAERLLTVNVDHLNAHHAGSAFRNRIELFLEFRSEDRAVRIPRRRSGGLGSSVRSNAEDNDDCKYYVLCQRTSISAGHYRCFGMLLPILLPKKGSSVRPGQSEQQMYP